jgi:dUTP pyrophosphatase
MKIKIKKLSENAVIPKYAMHGDAGMDLTVTDIEIVDHFHVKYKFGIAIEIPLGYVGLIFPRSSIYKQGQILTNSVGVIDSGYRGEICAVMMGNNSDLSYKVGDRAAQIMISPYPQIEFEESNDLSESERGSGGHGSTGNN